MSTLKADIIKTVRNWCIGNKFKPYIQIMYTEEIKQLECYSDNGVVTLSISETAVLYIDINKDFISLNITLNKIPTQIDIPIRLVISIFPKEMMSEGVRFPIPLIDNKTHNESLEEINKENNKKHTLRVIK